jgi:hypothetical protein
MATAAKTPAAPKTTPKAETPLGQVSPKWSQEFIVKQMFYRFQGARPEMDGRLKAAYTKRFNKKMRQMLPHEKSNAVYLEGPPGHGKTSAHRAAAKEFAKLMNMKFHEDVTQSMLSSGEIGINDFVFSIIELAGETSNKEVFGLMTKVRVDGREFMGHLPDWRLAATMFAGYGYVLFDDFATATHQVQNSTLGLLLNGSAGDLQFHMNDLGKGEFSTEHSPDGLVVIVDMPSNIAEMRRENASTVSFGLAGNRGLGDGNKTFPITTATSTRVYRFDIEDTPDLYIDRILMMNNDDIGDCQLSSFIEQNRDELFSKLAKQEKGQMGQMPVPRTWDMLLTNIRTEFAENGGVSEICKMNEKDMSVVLFDIEKAAQGAVGKEAASAVAAFYSSLFLGAAPIADAIIRRGEVDTAYITKKYNNGNDIDGQNFGFSLASSLASFATEDIAKIIGRSPSKKDLAELRDVDSEKSKEVRKVLEHFSYGLHQFTNLSMTTLAAGQFLRRLAISVPSMFVQEGDFHIPTGDAATLIATGIFADNQKHTNVENFESISDTLSTYSTNFDGALLKQVSGQIKAVLGK